jgi:hypothetical protein
VRIALFGLHRRGSVWVFVWISLAIALACVAYGFVEPVFFVGGLMVFSALWYYLAIRWVDRNSGFHSASESDSEHE